MKQVKRFCGGCGHSRILAPLVINYKQIHHTKNLCQHCAKKVISAAAQWWKFAHDGASTNPLGGTTWDTHSDERTKENVTTVSNALTTLDGLRPVTFNYTDDFVAKTDLPSSKKWGFLAQEFKNVISEGVTIRPNHDYEDFHMLNTDMLVPLLVKAVQELKAEVEQLKNSD